MPVRNEGTQHIYNSAKQKYMSSIKFIKAKKRGGDLIASSAFLPN